MMYENIYVPCIYLVELSAVTEGWLISSFMYLLTLFWMSTMIKNCRKMPKNSQNGKKKPLQKYQI